MDDLIRMICDKGTKGRKRLCFTARLRVEPEVWKRRQYPLGPTSEESSPLRRMALAVCVPTPAQWTPDAARVEGKGSATGYAALAGGRVRRALQDLGFVPHPCQRLPS